MKYIPQIIILSLSVLSISSCSKGLQAPDGALSAVVSGQEITVFHGQKQDDSTPALKMHVGLVSSADDFDSSLELKKVSASRSVHEDYTMVSGKRKHCVNDATERTYIYQNQDGKKMELVVRLYNDGIAVRYVLPAGTEIVEDRTAYIIPDGTKRWISPLKTDYEAFFPLIAVAVIYFILGGLFTFLTGLAEKFINPKRREREEVLKGVRTDD